MRISVVLGDLWRDDQHSNGHWFQEIFRLKSIIILDIFETLCNRLTRGYFIYTF